MTKTSKLSMIVLVLCLSVCLIHVPSVFASSESLYVDAFSSAVANWNTHTGHTPWLNNDATHSIAAFTDHVVDSAYGFADTSVSDFSKISSIKLMGMVKSNNELHYAALLLYGSGWSISYDVWGDGSGVYASFESGELKATISSIARINACLMNATKHGATTGTLTLQKVYLAIVYTAASTTFTIFSSTSLTFSEGSKKSMSFSEHALIPFQYLTDSSRAIVFQETSVIPFQFLEAYRKSVNFSEKGAVAFTFDLNHERALTFIQHAVIPLEFSEISKRDIVFRPLGSIPLNFIVIHFSPFADVLNLPLCIAALGFVLSIAALVISSTKKSKLLPLILACSLLSVVGLGFSFLDSEAYDMRLGAGVVGFVFSIVGLGFSNHKTDSDET